MTSPDYTTGPRGLIRALKGDSNISDIDAGFLAMATDVETKMANYSSGFASSRPPAGAEGRIFRATDTGEISFDTGSAWLALLTTPTTFATTGNYASSGISDGRGVSSGPWGTSAVLVSGSHGCVHRPYIFTFRAGFIGVNLTQASAPIYGLRFKLFVDGTAVTLDDGNPYIAYPVYQFAGQTPIALFNPSFTFTYTPTAGTHTFAVYVVPDAPGSSASVEGPYELIIA